MILPLEASKAPDVSPINVLFPDPFWPVTIVCLFLWISTFKSSNIGDSEPKYSKSTWDTLIPMLLFIFSILNSIGFFKVWLDSKSLSFSRCTWEFTKAFKEELKLERVWTRRSVWKYKF